MKIDLIDKVNIKDLNSSIGTQYISEGHTAGGSFLNNYHKHLPSILIGLPNSVLPDSLYVSCEDVWEDSVLVVEGNIKNEYLLSDLILSYSFVKDGEFFIVSDRIPYTPWEIELSAFSIYNSSYTSLYIKIEGIDYSTGELISVLQEIPLVLEEDCQETCADLAKVEAALYAVSRYYTEILTPVKITVNGRSYTAETLEDIKTLLNQEGIQVTFYEEYY